jgi:hypothetical protein
MPQATIPCRFGSYARLDERRYVAGLRQRLAAAGVSLWRDPVATKSGRCGPLANPGRHVRATRPARRRADL